MDEYKKNISTDWDRRVFNFGDRRTIEDAMLEPNNRRDNSGRHLKIGDFAKAYDRMSDAVTILGFGIDYRKYAKFMMLTPGISTRGGTPRPVGNKDLSNIQPAEFQFCYDFVIETALKLQEFAIDPDDLSTTRTAKKARIWTEEARKMMAEQNRTAEDPTD